MLDVRTPTVDEARAADLSRDIEGVIRERLGGEAVASVVVGRELDRDGDVVFLIDVFLSAYGGKLDAKRASDLIGRLMPAIDAYERGGFPLINYISQHE